MQVRGLLDANRAKIDPINEDTSKNSERLDELFCPEHI
jgi:hypothetical protein